MAFFTALTAAITSIPQAIKLMAEFVGLTKLVITKLGEVAEELRERRKIEEFREAREHARHTGDTSKIETLFRRPR